MCKRVGKTILYKARMSIKILISSLADEIVLIRKVNKLRSSHQLEIIDTLNIN